MASKINVGDKVGYSAKWLKSYGFLTGPVPFARGVVLRLEPFGNGYVASVDWDTPNIPERVLASNLARVGTIDFVE